MSYTTNITLSCDVGYCKNTYTSNGISFKQTEYEAEVDKWVVINKHNHICPICAINGGIMKPNSESNWLQIVTGSVFRRV